MQMDQFKIGFDRLVETFSQINPDKKARIYFEELKDMDATLFLETTRRIVREDTRFPPISRILELSNTIKPRSEEENKKADCKRCDGYGWVFFLGTAFRGRCEHGMKLSNKIAYVPETQVDMFNWSTKLEREKKEIYG